MPSRTGFFLPNDDEEIHPCDYATGTPAHPKWPVRRGIRQLTIIAGGQGSGVLVEDGVCAHWDMPILHNVNIPVPGTPFGMGEPFRLEKIQRANSRLIKAMVEHAEAFKAPAQITTASLAAAYEEATGNTYVKSNTVAVVADEDFKACNGELVHVIEPPAMPAGLLQLQPILRSMITEQSGHTEVLQGRASSQLSGRAIETLQTSAASMIGFKAQRTGDMVWRLARLILHSIVHSYDLPDLYRIVSKYPPNILAAIQQRALNMDWDVKVEVSSGNAAMKAQRRAEAQQDLQVGAITLETYHEKTGTDHKLEEKRMRAQQEKQLALQAKAMQAGGGQPQPSNKEPSQQGEAA